MIDILLDEESKDQKIKRLIKRSFNQGLITKRCFLWIFFDDNRSDNDFIFFREIDGPLDLSVMLVFRQMIRNNEIRRLGVGFYINDQSANINEKTLIDSLYYKHKIGQFDFGQKIK